MSELLIIERDDGRFDWRVVAGNGEQTGGSAQGFRDAHDARRGFMDHVSNVLDVMQRLAYESDRGVRDCAIRFKA